MQEVKVTLSAQLKETKQMVSDASITAQNASRFILIFLHFLDNWLMLTPKLSTMLIEKEKHLKRNASGCQQLTEMQRALLQRRRQNLPLKLSSWKI